MSLRWRKNGQLICGAKSEPEEGDTYINDGLHYQLSVMCGAIKPHDDEAETGLWDFVEMSDGERGEYLRSRFKSGHSNP